MDDENIYLSQVTTHNLKGFDVRFPLNRMTVVTGVSGSGKTSLVFDTLYGESYRRYLESLSSFARQYLDALPRPGLAKVKNLPPAIAVRQRRKGANKRSTVGTLTESLDHLQTIFAASAELSCPQCREPVKARPPSKVAVEIERRFQGTKTVLTAPLVPRQGVSAQQLRQYLAEQGFTRLWVDGAAVLLANYKFQEVGALEVVIDRFLVCSKNSERILESIQLAYRLGKGKLRLWQGANCLAQFSEHLECQLCGALFQAPSPALFSFNHPRGACSECQGYGEVAVVDWRKVFPDLKSSIHKRGIVALNFGQHADYYDRIKESAKTLGYSPAKNFSEYSHDEWDWIKYGDGNNFSGITGYFDWLESKKYKPHYRMHRARFIRYITCEVCEGARFSLETLAYKYRGRSIAEFLSMSAKDLLKHLPESAEYRDKSCMGNPGALEALKDLRQMLDYLCEVGLPYLSLVRTSTSLSGGELQRIQLARCLGSSLTETLFCLDEPSAGLHAKDVEKLLRVLNKLKGNGNTLVVVEHNQAVIAAADHKMEVGPGAGHEGGRLLPELKEVPSFSPAAPNSCHNQKPQQHDCNQNYTPRSTKNWPIRSRLKSDRSRTVNSSIRFLGSKLHNLKGDEFRVPLGRITVVCGLSGSGKSTLVEHYLYPQLRQALEQRKESKKGELHPHVSLDEALNLEGVYLVSQAPLGRSSRSNIVTYLGVYAHIRQIFAQQDLAKKLGFGPGFFSFNVPGGRCEECKGMGTVSQDLSFLGEVDVVCHVCNGARFSEQVLQVKYKGFSLNQILDLTVKQAKAVFCDHPKITEVLNEVTKLGLDYVTLGQATSTFSGGEAQRLKLLSMAEIKTKSKKVCLIFDEPSVGLAHSDVSTLLNYFSSLSAQGHTIIVVEHNLQVIHEADFVIELGPGASTDGGRIVFQGTREEFSSCRESNTAPYLERYNHQQPPSSRN